MRTLVGRERELRILDSLLEVTQAGVGATLLIEGEAGVGKTRLVDHLVEQARIGGMTVLRGGAHPMERTRPFGAVADALALRRPGADVGQARVRRWLEGEPDHATLPPDAEPTDLRFRVVEAILDLVEAVTAAAPTVIAIEDLHWADDSTLLAVGRLARECAELPLLLVASLRPSPRSPVLEQLLEELSSIGARTIGLLPLDAADVGVLVEHELGLRAGPGLTTVLAKAGGNPLFIVEMLRSLAADGRIEEREGTAEERGPGLPDSFRDLVVRRLRFLPQPTLELLRVGAVLGDAVSIRDLAVAARWPTPEVVAALVDAFQARLLDDRGDRLVFRHQLVQEAIYQDIPGPIRRALHRDAATTLAEAGADLAQVASHLMRGAETGDAEAVRLLRRAAREAAAREPAVAVELLRRALWLLPSGDPDADIVTAELIDGLFLAGRVAEAASLAERTLARPHAPESDRVIRLALVSALSLQNRLPELEAFADATLRTPEVLSAADRALVLAQSSFSRTLAGDHRGGEEAARRALEEAERSGEAGVTAWSLTAVSVPVKAQGGYAEAIELGRRAVALATSPPDVAARLRHPHFFLGMALCDADELQQARQAYRTAIDECGALGSAWILSDVLLMAADLRFLAGEWEDAAVELDAGLRVARENGTHILVVRTLGLQAFMAVGRGDLGTAGDTLAVIEPDLGRDRTGWGAEMGICAAAALAEARGDPAVGMAMLARAWAQALARGDRYWDRYLGPPLVRLALASGDTVTARAVAGSMDEGVALAPGVRSLHAAALRCRALGERDPELARDAVALARVTPRQVDLPGVLEDAAEVLVVAAQRSEAITLLEEARDRSLAMGADGWAARIASTLRSLGVRHGARGTRRRPEVGWESLTASERSVSDLVAEGLTNREIARRLFISPHTVNSHLRHVFQKLDVPTRAALAVTVQRRGATNHVNE